MSILAISEIHNTATTHILVNLVSIFCFVHQFEYDKSCTY